LTKIARYLLLLADDCLQVALTPTLHDFFHELCSIDFSAFFAPLR
jgi:hypothetical protein